MKQLIVYLHGRGGSASKADIFKPLFPNSEVIGFDYKSQTPWDARDEFTKQFDEYAENYDSIIVIGNSLGAFFAMFAGVHKKIKMAFFFSPIVDMEKLISDMMVHANVTEDDLQQQQEIKTDFGETLSWEYLCYIRQHPIKWNIPTHIAYGEHDNFTSIETMQKFADKINASLTVMPNGEHWFHTDEQLNFLKNWIKNQLKN